MKRIYMTLGLLGITMASFAQRDINLKVEMIDPTTGMVMDNPANGDTVNYAFKITNEGPEAVDPTDILLIVTDNKYLGTGDGETPSFQPVAMSNFISEPMPQDSTLTLFLQNLVQGTNVQVPTDATTCTFVEVAGVDSVGMPYTDPDFDVTKLNGALDENGNVVDGQMLYSAFTGDNIGKAENIKIGSGANSVPCYGEGVGIKKVAQEKVNLQVYPNPAASNVNFAFSLTKNADNAAIRISDVTGRTVYTQALGKVNAGDHTYNINVSSLNAGLYFIELNTGNQHGVSKFTIRK